MGSQRRWKKQAKKRRKVRVDLPSGTHPGGESIVQEGDRSASPRVPGHGRELIGEDCQTAKNQADGDQTSKNQADKELSTQAGDHVVLLRDKGGPRAILTSSEEGVWLKMLDENGNLRVRIGVDEVGLPALTFFTAADVPGVGTKERCSIERLALECTPDLLQPEYSVPVLALWDAGGNRQALLIAGAGGESSLTFYRDRAGPYGWSLHSALGVTQYKTGSTDEMRRLRDLWEAGEVMRAVRNGGKIPAAEVIARLMTVYEVLVI
ncbi:MAG TPA: hypothetical protein VI756_26935 [Blastocatellia bacterium]